MEFDLPQTVDKIDAIPNDFRPLYAEKEGKFVLGENLGPVAGAIIGLHKTVKATRTEADTLRKGAIDLSPLADFGASPAEIKAAFDARVQELTSKGGDKAAAIEAVRKEMATAHTKAMEGLTKQNEGLRGQLYTHLVRNAATSAISEFKGIPELLMPFVEKAIKVVDSDGQITPTVVNPETGEQRYGATGQPMTIKELVSEMKGNATYARLFESDVQNGGTGSQPGNRGKVAPNQTGAGQKTSNAKIAAGLTKQFGQMGRMG